MLQIEKNQIQYPTRIHEQFVRQIIEICSRQNIPIYLKGSLAKGTAMEYSDIDMILVGLESAEEMDSIIGSFDDIILSEKMITSTLMVIYKCGLAVEYDIRKTITKEDIYKSICLGIETDKISDIPRDRVEIDSILAPRRRQEYSSVMIVQMCCAKLLCQKEELARDIYCDRMMAVYSEAKLPFGFVQMVHLESINDFVVRLKKQVFRNINTSSILCKYFDALFRKIEQRYLLI